MIVKDENGQIRRFTLRPTENSPECETLAIIAIDGELPYLPKIGDILQIRQIAVLVFNGNIVSVLPPADSEAAEQEKIKWS